MAEVKGEMIVWPREEAVNSLRVLRLHERAAVPRVEQMGTLLWLAE
jgi:hypothetical protein